MKTKTRRSAEDREIACDIRRNERTERINRFLCRIHIHRAGDYIMQERMGRGPALVRFDFDKMPRTCYCGRVWWWPL